MPVAQCSSCGRGISISNIPGGNPVASAEGWATTYKACVCGRAYCDRCFDREPLCPECPGPPKPHSKQSQLTRLWTMSCHSKKYWEGDFVTEAWGFTSAYGTIDEKIQGLQRELKDSILKSFAEAASRLLANRGDFDAMEWPGDYNTPEVIPREFILKLAACAGPRSDG
jgi:hypothetical protein